MQKNSKKLKVDKETFKVLTPDQLTEVAGGDYPGHWTS